MNFVFWVVTLNWPSPDLDLAQSLTKTFGWDILSPEPRSESGSEGFVKYSHPPPPKCHCLMMMWPGARPRALLTLTSHGWVPGAGSWAGAWVCWWPGPGGRRGGAGSPVRRIMVSGTRPARLSTLSSHVSRLSVDMIKHKIRSTADMCLLHVGP